MKILLTLFCFINAARASTSYVSENGTRHFVDSPADIPEKYRTGNAAVLKLTDLPSEEARNAAHKADVKALEQSLLEALKAYNLEIDAKDKFDPKKHTKKALTDSKLSVRLQSCADLELMECYKMPKSECEKLYQSVSTTCFASEKLKNAPEEFPNREAAKDYSLSLSRCLEGSFEAAAKKREQTVKSGFCNMYTDNLEDELRIFEGKSKNLNPTDPIRVTK
jgi:hypothetical protein